MNLKYQFYKGYYKGFDPCWFDDDKRKKALDEKNTTLFEVANKRLFNYTPSQNLAKWQFKKTHFGDKLRQFSLETTYPGLTSGTGYTHETGNVGEFKIGFHFDHTSGLPMLPGHSVKGALRAAFPQYKMEPKSSEPKSIKQAKAEYIIGLLGLTEKVAQEKRLAWVSQLELQIFGTSHAAAKEKNKDEKEDKKPPPKDVFLDAMIVKADRKGKILGADSITPHGDKVWKNPTPLLFLKVLPEVQWRFSFLLHNTNIEGVEVKADQKEALFKAILLDMGIGAKSNVGYGHFIDPENRPSGKFDPKGDLATDAKQKYRLAERPKRPVEAEEPKEIKAEYLKAKLTHKKELIADALVVEAGKKAKVKIFLKEDKSPIVSINRDPGDLKEGEIIVVTLRLTKALDFNYINFKKRKK